MHIALIGDFNADVAAHQAINASLDLAAKHRGHAIETTWIATATLKDPTSLSGYDGAWLVPASPYESFNNALAALQYIRENNMPFLGTCGGYQHALVEYARNVLGYDQAGITEVDEDCAMPLVSPLVCALIEETDPVIPEPNGLIARLCGIGDLHETYHCSFGINPEHAQIFDDTNLKVAARDGEGAIRAMALDGHPFFLGTAFQPERAGLADKVHPIVSGFLAAI